MMNDTIRKLIDSCRSQGDDLRQPEMQPLADLIADDAIAARQLERSRRLDDTITAAVHNVPTPAGLEQRLLTALADSAAVATETPSVSPGEPSLVEDQPAGRADGDELVVRPKSQIVQVRRRRLWMAVGACAAVTLVIAIAVSQSSGGIVGYDELVASALTWEVSGDAWVDGNLIWKSHPLSKEIRANVQRRQEFTLPRYRVATRCYDLRLRNGGNARVFVFSKPSRFELPTAPPAAPMYALGGCVAAWTSGDLVYVLVVYGTEAEKKYKEAIRRASQVTVRWPVNEIPCPTGTV
jgi:hypothetical protein